MGWFLSEWQNGEIVSETILPLLKEYYKTVNIFPFRWIEIDKSVKYGILKMVLFVVNT